MPKINQTAETVIVSPQGEVLESSQTRVMSWESEPPYIKIYLKDIMYLSDMPNHYFRVLFSLLKVVPYAGEKNGMCISLSAGMKRMMAEELNIKDVRSINNAISRLSKKKVLYRIDTGMYVFNTFLFGKGNWNDIKSLRMNLDYGDIADKTFGQKELAD